MARGHKSIAVRPCRNTRIYWNTHYWDAPTTHDHARDSVQSNPLERSNVLPARQLDGEGIFAPDSSISVDAVCFGVAHKFPRIHIIEMGACYLRAARWVKLKHLVSTYVRGGTVLPGVCLSLWCRLSLACLHLYMHLSLLLYSLICCHRGSFLVRGGLVVDPAARGERNGASANSKESRCFI